MKMPHEFTGKNERFKVSASRCKHARRNKEMRANLASFEAVCVEDVTVALVAFLGFHVFFLGGTVCQQRLTNPIDYPSSVPQ